MDVKKVENSLFDKIDCIRIPVPNLEEGIIFYVEKLGHKIIWKTKIAAGLKLANDKSEIVLYTGQEGLEIDFKVKDISQAVNTFVKAGGEIITGPFDIQIGKCAVVKDPWGNQFVILDSSKGKFVVDENKEVIGLKKE
ncbi:MAG: bleomycin resistance protein [Asgard group archaeon]|nr:bleomycin resistance protein [Asgard group archaeon]